MQSNRADERNMKWSNRKGFLQRTNSDAMVWEETEQTEPWSADFAHSFPFQTLLELLIHKGRQVKTISFHLQTGDQQRYLRFPLIICVLLLLFFSKGTSLWRAGWWEDVLLLFCWTHYQASELLLLVLQTFARLESCEHHLKSFNHSF